MFSFRNSTTLVSSVLKAERIAHQELTRELLEKIAQIEADLQLHQERESALLDLLGTYRDEMTQKFEDFKTSLLSPDIHTSATPPISTYSAGSHSSPAHSYIPDSSMEAFEQNMTRYILQGAEAIKSLLTLSASYSTLALFRTSSQDEDYHAAEANLYRIPGIVSRFACQVADLRQDCMRAQDVLVPRAMDWYMAHAKTTLRKFINTAETQPAPMHPRELTFHFHGLQEMLAELCQDSWCLGHQSEYCIHRLTPGIDEPKEDEVMGVTIVHPGSNWDDVKRYLFAGLKGMTTLAGEIFCLVDLAMLRDRWSYGFLDEASWDEAYHYIDEIDVFWLVPDDLAVSDQVFQDLDGHNDVRSIADSVAANVADSVHEFSEGESELVDTFHNRYTNPVAQSVDLDGDEFSQTELMDNSMDALAELALHVQPRDSLYVKAGGSSSRGSSSSHSREGRQRVSVSSPVQSNPHRYLRAGEGSNASTFTRGREDGKQTPTTPPVQLGPYAYLRAGEGSQASRSPSFIQNREDDKPVAQTLPARLDPHPYLKAGEGLRRRSQPPPSARKWR